MNPGRRLPAVRTALQRHRRHQRLGQLTRLAPTFSPTPGRRLTDNRRLRIRRGPNLGSSLARGADNRHQGGETLLVRCCKSSSRLQCHSIPFALRPREDETEMPDGGKHVTEAHPQDGRARGSPPPSASRAFAVAFGAACGGGRSSPREGEGVSMPLHDQLESLANYHLPEYSVCCEDIPPSGWPRSCDVATRFRSPTTAPSSPSASGVAQFSDEAPAIIAARADETRRRVRRYLVISARWMGPGSRGPELDVPDGRPVSPRICRNWMWCGAVHARTPGRQHDGGGVCNAGRCSAWAPHHRPSVPLPGAEAGAGG